MIYNQGFITYDSTVFRYMKTNCDRWIFQRCEFADWSEWEFTSKTFLQKLEEFEIQEKIIRQGEV